MNLVIIFICVAVGLIFTLKNKQSIQNNKKFKKFQKLKKTNRQNNTKNDTILNNLIERIDLSKDTQIIKHHSMSIKCIRAGIRSARIQKMCILAQYILIIPFGLIASFCGWFFYGGILHITIGAFAGGVLGFFFPIIRIDSMAKDRQLEIEQAFPDFVDLMLVCIEAGMSAEQAYAKIANDLKKFSMVMAEEIQLLSAEITYFLDPKSSYDNFYYRTQNEYIKAFCNVVLQSLQSGTPLGSGLRMLSMEIREAQMGKIERKAAALPSKLTVPMMVFTLPVLFVVILYPAIVTMIRDFKAI